MAIIEKKYLLYDAIITLLAKTKEERICQFYTQIEYCKETRYQKSNNSFYKTIKTGSEVRKNAVNKEISEKKFNQAKENRVGHILKKERFQLKGYPKQFAVDIYKKDLKNIYLLEVRFKTLDEAASFILPDALKSYIKQDVSDNERYRNKNLALLGNPQKKSYNIYAIFKDIEQNRVKNVSKFLFDEMIVSDAVRIVLYKIYHDLQTNRQDLLQNDDAQTIEHFSKNLKQAKIILDAYMPIFDTQMYKKTRLHISMIEKTIATVRDLIVIKSNLKLLKSTFSEQEINSFITRVDKRIKEEKHRVKHFFKTREFAIIFSQFELLIKERSNIYPTYYANTSIENVLKNSVNKRFKKLLKLTEKYDKCHDFYACKKMQKSLQKTQILLDNFLHLYPKKEYAKMQTLLNNTNNEYLRFIALNRRSLIIKTYIKNSNKSLKEQQKLIGKVQKRKKSLEKQINIDIDESIAALKENKALFKKH